MNNYECPLYRLDEYSNKRVCFVDGKECSHLRNQGDCFEYNVQKRLLLEKPRVMTPIEFMSQRLRLIGVIRPTAEAVFDFGSDVE